MCFLCVDVKLLLFKNKLMGLYIIINSQLHLIINKGIVHIIQHKKVTHFRHDAT